jgi:RHS repeat-associated protein
MTKKHGPWKRAIAVTLVAGQIVISLPPASAAAGVTDAAESTVAASAARVRVNRTVPKVEPPPLVPSFSAMPTAAEIGRARVFGEPLTAIGGEPSAAERRALGAALAAYARSARQQRLRVLQDFLARHPDSRYRASLLAGLATEYRQAGYFSRAVESLDEAWRLSRGLTEERAQGVSLKALSDLLEIHLVFGHTEALERTLAQVDPDMVRGAATERVVLAREGLWTLKNHHEDALPSGSTALDRILARQRPGAPPHPRLAAFPATHHGASLPEIHALASAVGLSLTMARRSGSAEFPVPSVVHLKVGHFVAVVARQGELYEVDDPALQALWGTRWLTRDALVDEASSYALVPDPLPPGWNAVGSQEAAAIRGKCFPSTPDPAATGPCNTTVKGQCENAGMAGYNVHSLVVSLTINDTPLFYSPPRGPAVKLRLTYNQREFYQPQTFSFANLGPKWTFDWLSYVVSTSQPWVYLAGGGRETYVLGTPNLVSGAVLVQISESPLRYERRLPDGSVEVFALPEGGPGSRVFMTEFRDPQGQALTFTYDASLRMVAVTDALGQVTTLAYEGLDPLLVTRVTDPFGRSAQLQYNAQGRLESITDVIGLVSRFTYASADVISTMETAYGTTRFRAGDLVPSGALGTKKRFVEVVDPLGGREYVELAADSGRGTTSFWDKRAMAMDPLGLGSARSWSWRGKPVLLDRVMSEARPLESPIVYTYDDASTWPLASMWPSSASRLLDDNTEQTYQWEYNAIGNTTKVIDPEGRETILEYADNDIDVLRSKQKNGAGYDLTQSVTYNSAHRPLTVTDASGKTTTFSYTPLQQLETVTTPRNETWTLTYDPQGNYLQSISGPLPGATTGVTWDGFGRMRTITDADYDTVTIDYDALNRPLQVTYPNGSREEVVWEKLHVRKYRDPRGRWTEVFADAVGRPTGIRDSWGRLVAFEWCDCGSLTRVVDAKGNATSWERDLLGRVTRETLSNGSGHTVLYEQNTSRLKRITDAKGQATNVEHFRDDRIKRISYANTPVATADVSFTYDSVYGRPATRTDGTGTTVYSYHPVGVPPVLGAGLLASIDGPLSNDLVTYTYDELGRVLSRAIGGTTTSVTYDPLGRISTAANALGTFNYGHDGATSRVATVSGPGGLLRSYAYHDQSHNRMLREIRNTWNGSPLSTFTYEYNANRKITAWTQQAGAAPARRYELAYVQAGQLGSAVLKNVADGTVLKSYAFEYDPALNRISEQAAGTVASTRHDALNQLASRQAGGAMRFAGFTNEVASVTVQGQPATVDGSNNFDTKVQVSGGPNAVTVVATDPSNNTGSRVYDVTVTGQSATFSHDANGNLTSDGTRSYVWDAANRLVAIEQETHRTEFHYDGLSRRIRIVEKENGAITADARFLWVGTQMVEERDATGGAVSKRFFGQGLRIGNESYFYAKDHLGSIRELVDASGTVRTRHDYDPFGGRTKVAGDLEADLGFTGHPFHQPSGLHLALYRAYDARLGRWLSRDPIGFAGGFNLYAYVFNDPVNLVDPDGRLALLPLVAAAILMLLMTPDIGNAPGNSDPTFVSDQSGALIAQVPLAPIVGPLGNKLGRLCGRLISRLAGKGGKSAAELGAAIGRRLGHLEHGKMEGLAREVTEAGLSQSEAAIAVEHGVTNMGGNLRTAPVQVGDDIVMVSAPGSSSPVLVVRPDGSVVQGRATIDYDKLGNAIITNIRCRQ